MPLGFQDNPGNILGTNSASNQYNSSSVTADADGSIIERLESIQQKVGAVDATDNILGANDADNGFDSSSVVGNADGSIIERIEYLQDELAATGIEAKVDTLTTTVGTPAGADIATDIAAVKTEVDKIGTPAGADVSTDIAAVKTEVDKIGTPAGADVSTDIAAIKTEVDKIGTPAGADVSTDIASLSTLIGTPAGADVSTDVAAIKTEADKIGTPAGADVSTDIASVKTSVDNFAAGGGFGKAIVRKTVTFSNTNADVDLFTVTGTVIARVFCVCTTGLASAGTCAISVYTGSATLIASTASTDVAAGEIWHDNSPDAEAELLSVAPDYIISDGNDIVLDVEAAHQVDSGVLEFYCIYTPLSADGAVAAAS